MCRLTLGAGDAGGVATPSLGTVEVGAVVQAVGQRHLGAGAAHAAHHHGVGAHLPGPVPRLLEGNKSHKGATLARWDRVDVLDTDGLKQEVTTSEERLCSGH